MTLTKPHITLGAVGLTAALLLACDNESQEMGSQDVGEKVGEAVEETREAANAAAAEAARTTDQAVDQTREAIEEAGDKIESATD